MTMLVIAIAITATTITTLIVRDQLVAKRQIQERIDALA